MKLGKVVAGGLVGAAMLAMGGTANAALTCNGTAASDVTLTIAPNTYYAASCSNLNFANNNANTIRNAFNSALTAAGTADDFTFILRDDTAGGSPATGSAFGLNFTLSATVGATSGVWTLTWTDPVPVDLPLMMDFGVVLKGGPAGAGYILPDVVLTANPNTGTGSFVIEFLNPGGQNPNLSGLSILGRNPRPYTPPPPTDVPEPASLALLGMGLLGLGFAARRRRG